MLPFTSTAVCLRRASGYHNRVVVFAHRRNKARYLAPKTPYKRTPLANKNPESYHETWDPRSGIEWYNRMRHRGAYRHWPWATWSDDPIRFHQKTIVHRPISKKDDANNSGDATPLWDYYREVGQAYDISDPETTSIQTLGTYMHPYVRHLWSRERIAQFLKTIEEEVKEAHSVASVAKHPESLLGWLDALESQREGDTPSECEESSRPPKAFMQHVVLLCADVVLYHSKLQHRAREHQERGVLRTREMEKYFALPYLHVLPDTPYSEETKGAAVGVRGLEHPMVGIPAMPVRLEQASGQYPWGKYTYMGDDVMSRGEVVTKEKRRRSRVGLDPLYRVDGWFKDNQYPA